MNNDGQDKECCVLQMMFHCFLLASFLGEKREVITA